MIISMSRKFVFFSTPKCASTSIEFALRHYAQVILGDPPALKHMSYLDFQRHILPFLRHARIPIDKYTMVALYREPLDWLYSWYRYRSRKDVAGQTTYAGDVDFRTFVNSHLSENPPAFARVPAQSTLFLGRAGERAPITLFRYEQITKFLDYMSEIVNHPITIPQMNVTPVRKTEDLAPYRDEFRAKLAQEYEIYNSIQ